MGQHEKLEINQRLWNGIHLLQDKLKLDDETLSKRANISWQKFIFCKNNNLSLPFYCIENLSKALDLSIDSIISGICSSQIEAMSIQHSWQESLVEKYKIGKGSKSFSLRHILKITHKYNLYEETIAHFNLNTQQIESKIDYDIPVQLVSDVLDYIASRVPLTDEDLRYISSLNAFYFKDTSFGKLLKQAKKPQEVYEYLIYLTKFIEENWDYSIAKMNNKKIIINSSPSEKVSDLYKKSDYSSLNLTRYRAFFAGGLTQYIGLHDMKTEITKSVHLGDNYDQFTIHFDNIKPLETSGALYLQ